MTPRLPFRILLIAAAFGFLAGCAVPLGPAFRRSNRVAEIADASAEPGRISLRITDELENIGDRNLQYLDFALSEAATRRLKVMFAGSSVSVSQLESGPAAPFRIRISDPWSPGQRRQVAFDYDLAPGDSDSGIISATSEGLCLTDPSVFPQWISPPGFFSQALLQRTESLSLSLPDDFRIVASGRLRRQRRGTLLYFKYERFGADFRPYVIAGKYLEHRVETNAGSVIFWTFDPVDGAAAQALAEHARITFAAYEKYFGPVARADAAVRIIQTPELITNSVDFDVAVGGGSIPRGVLIDKRSLGIGLGSGVVKRVADFELSRTWFGWRVRLSPGSELLFGRGMALFATTIAARTHGGDAARLQSVRDILAAYDHARAIAPEKVGTLEILTPAERITAVRKLALFLVSLEDLAGEEKFSAALRHIQSALVGDEAGDDELRAALEAETGRDLAAVFRTWLERSDLPSDFRSRYTGNR